METLAPTEIRYPYAIVRACSELPYTSAFLEMPDGFLRIVLKIVQKINLRNPFSEIFASRQTLAVESGKSLDSVHRAISWLEKQNLIERERVARAGLRGSRSPLVPTQQMLFALGLVDAHGKASVKPMPVGASVKDQAHQAAPDHTGQIPTTTVSPPHQQGYVEASSRVGQEYTRVGPVCLPSDLVWMCSKGVTPFGVLGLMKHAKQAGQRLSDVVKACHKYLGGLKSNELFAYIKALLLSGRDFSTGIREEEKHLSEMREKEYLREKAEIYEGKRFISKKSGKVFQIESGAVRETGGGRTGLAPFTQAFLDAVEAGKLVPYSA